MLFAQRVVDACIDSYRSEGDLDILGLAGPLGEGQATQRHGEFLIGSHRIARERHTNCLLESRSLDAVVSSQILVELIAVEVTQNRLRSTGQCREGIASSKEEGHRPNRVLLVHINGRTIDEQRGNALTVRLGRIVGVLDIL